MQSWLVLANRITQLYSCFGWEVFESAAALGLFETLLVTEDILPFLFHTERQLIAGRPPLIGEGCSQTRCSGEV